MFRRIAPIVAIYILAAVGWMILGTSVQVRTYSADERLHERVASLWGQPQTQVSPTVVFTWPETETSTETVVDEITKGKKLVTRDEVVWKDRPVILDHSHLDVDLRLDQRKKGLLWYATYGVTFHGKYAYTNLDAKDGAVVIRYRFPSRDATYSDFRFVVAGQEDAQITPANEGQAKVVVQRIPIRRGQTIPFEVSYASRGLDTWRYSFGDDVSRIKDFDLAMTTDFRQIDFPSGTLSPDQKVETASGWRLRWHTGNLVSGLQVGMSMPHNLNPGPLAARISYFAPVCLGFFFVWIFVVTILRQIDLHPMNYLFLGAAFFAFHLLLSYTVDHVSIGIAFALASCVSVFLVVTYLRLVAGLRFAAVEAGIGQLVYLVLFSCAHFFEGFTGLIVTIGSILTLFVLMQATGRVRWSEVFAKKEVTLGAHA